MGSRPLAVCLRTCSRDPQKLPRETCNDRVVYRVCILFVRIIVHQGLRIAHDSFATSTQLCPMGVAVLSLLTLLIQTALSTRARRRNAYTKVAQTEQSQSPDEPYDGSHSVDLPPFAGHAQRGDTVIFAFNVVRVASALALFVLCLSSGRTPLLSPTDADARDMETLYYVGTCLTYVSVFCLTSMTLALIIVYTALRTGPERCFAIPRTRCTHHRYAPLQLHNVYDMVGVRVPGPLATCHVHPGASGPRRRHCALGQSNFVDYQRCPRTAFDTSTLCSL